MLQHFHSKPPSRQRFDRYVAKSDDVYTWKLANTIPGDGFRTFILESTSQTWRSPYEKVAEAIMRALRL